MLLLQPEGGAGNTAVNTAQAFAVFYEQYMPKVFGYISYRVNDRQTAEDLTSTVFEKALSKFSSYNSQRAALSTWVFSIARNTLIDHYRTARGKQTVQIDDALDIADGRRTPEEEAVKADEMRRLQSSMAGLSQHEREIITLKFGGEMTNREIAKSTGLSESNVGIIIFRAVRKMRDSFEEGQDG